MCSPAEHFRTTEDKQTLANPAAHGIPTTRIVQKGHLGNV